MYSNGWWNWGLNTQTARFRNCLRNERDYGTKTSVLVSNTSRCTNCCFLQYIRNLLFSAAHKLMHSLSLSNWCWLVASSGLALPVTHQHWLKHRATSKCDARRHFEYSCIWSCKTNTSRTITLLSPFKIFWISPLKYCNFFFQPLFVFISTHILI